MRLARQEAGKLGANEIITQSTRETGFFGMTRQGSVLAIRTRPRT